MSDFHTNQPETSSSTTSKPGVLCTNFNQDASSVSIGTKGGLRIWSINNAGLEIQELHNDEKMQRTVLAERLFSSSLLVIVSQAQPKRLRLFHFRRNTEICAYSYSSTILSVELNRLRLVVILENAIWVHNIKDMKVLHNIKDTPSNPKGISCLSTTEHHPLLAYPGSTVNGQVHVFDCARLSACAAIQAHRTPIVALAIHDYQPEGSTTSGPSSGVIHEEQAMNNMNTGAQNPINCFYNVPNIRAILATASTTGTVVRLWALKTIGTVEQLAELRRGVRRHALIESMNFSEDGKWLALASDTETIHIWRLDKLCVTSKDNNQFGGVLSGESPEGSTSSNNPPMGSAPGQVISSGGSTTIGVNPSINTGKEYLSSWLSWGMNQANDLAKQVLPTSVGNALSAERAFITAQLPASGLKSRIAIIPNGLKHVRILVCTKEGYLLVYDASIDEGGEANLVKQHCLTNDCEAIAGDIKSDEENLDMH